MLDTFRDVLVSGPTDRRGRHRIQADCLERAGRDTHTTTGALPVIHQPGMDRVIILNRFFWTCRCAKGILALATVPCG